MSDRGLQTLGDNKPRVTIAVMNCVEAVEKLQFMEEATVPVSLKEYVLKTQCHTLNMEVAFRKGFYIQFSY